MRIYNFFAEVEEDKAFIRDKQEITHLSRVLRLRTGDRVRLIDGYSEYLAEIESIGSKSVHLKVLEKKKDSYSLDKEIDLYVGIVKTDAFSMIVRQATEIGLSSLCPLITRYSGEKVNLEKLASISKEAAKQCWAVKPIELKAPLRIEHLSLDGYDLVLTALERSEAKPLKGILDMVSRAKKVALLIGPEGGFSAEERELLLKVSEAISLGRRIYRTETAAAVLSGIAAQL